MILFLIGFSSACKKSESVLIVLGGHEYDTTEFFETFGSLNGIAHLRPDMDQSDSFTTPSALFSSGTDLCIW